MDSISRDSGRSDKPNPRPESRMRVGLSTSPKRPASRETMVPDGLANQHAVSDLPSQPKKQINVTKETPVPLPFIPGMSHPPQQPVKSQHVHPKQTPVPLPQRPAATAPKSSGAVAVASASGRGRPKGWKPGMSYAEMRGNPPPGSKGTRAAKPRPGQLGVVKRKGRPPKQPSPSPTALYGRLSPPFIAFLCEWKGCKAELQNLETLRRHVDIIHLEEQEDEWCCKWGKCGDRDPIPEFPGPTELEDHVEEVHLGPFAWHVGDGPANSSGSKDVVKHDEDEDEIPDYLKDADGNQVTPSIRDQVVEDYVTWRNNRRKLKELLLERDRNLPSDEEDGSGEEDEVVK